MARGDFEYKVNEEIAGLVDKLNALKGIKDD